MLDVSSQTSEDPFYQRVLRLVKTLVSARAIHVSYQYLTVLNHSACTPQGPLHSV